MSFIGKEIRLKRIFSKDRCVLLPIDDSLIDGPEGGLRNTNIFLSNISGCDIDGIICFKGVLKQHYKLIMRTPIIMNLTASTSLGLHTKKSLVGSVEEAISMGCDGVSVHVNISSKYEPSMLSTLGLISKECDTFGMPLIAMMYPRSENGPNDNNYLDVKMENPKLYSKMVRHAARVGVDLGADIIKTHYTGSPDTLKTVIDSCSGVPVVIAGGDKINSFEMLTIAKHCMVAGAKGVCFGRNTFNRTDPKGFLTDLSKIVHGFSDKSNHVTVAHQLNMDVVA